MGGAMMLIVGYRWTTSMQSDVKAVPGQIMLAQPPGTVPRDAGQGELVVDRAAYETRKNPMPATAESIARGDRLYQVYCTPCHGADGKGNGPVAARYIPPADLTSPAVQAKSDGHISYYIGYGGAIMPGYGEAMSVADRWDLVNFVRTLARK
jgi:mono/diheme cytochrome c family protein